MSKIKTENVQVGVSLDYIKKVFLHMLRKNYLTKAEKQVLLNNYEILENYIEELLQVNESNKRIIRNRKFFINE